MNYRIRDISDVTEPIDIATAKVQLKELPDNTEDALLTSYIKAARRYVERGSERRLVDKNVILQIEAFPGGDARIELPISTESAEITSITYLDAEGTTQTIAGTDIALSNVPQPNYIRPKTGDWPTEGTDIIIRYVATTELEHLDGLIPAILLLVGHYYQHRTVTDMGMATNIEHIIRKHRRYTAL